MNTITTIEGNLSGTGKKFALVVGRFNSLITERLVEGAVDCLQRHGTSSSDLTMIRVPGSWEIPIAAKRAAESASYDGVICLGAVIRGGTPHFDYVAAEVSKGVAAIGMETGVPVTFGVLTTDTIEQAIERAGTKAGNKGWEAAEAALEMADLFQAMDG
ncbi:MAG TPA: 6,7-dimethyl-8-ribityllumazine synthase [Alkalispirochaeta sp.]|nr:6,7-dimethyl-8-ribityllumazine synthase [Alkalispirochaeta sp.]